MPDTEIMGKKVKHYRLNSVDIGQDVPPVLKGAFDFGYERADQQDFYCEWEENICNPVRWEIHGYNTMSGSHFDYYVLDINTFERVATNKSTIAVNMTCSTNPISVNRWSNLIRRHALAP